QAKLPKVVIIEEESIDFANDSTDNYVVIVESIDGTENFCSGLAEWGVAFGLWKGTTFLGGFLMMPELGIRLMTGDQLQYIKSRITGTSCVVTPAVINTISEPGEYRMTGC